MAKSKANKGSSGKAETKASGKKLFSDPPVIVGGGSVNVFFKSNATEVVPSPKAGYRCFKVPGTIKNLAFYDGESPGITNLEVKNSKTFFAQTDE